MKWKRPPITKIYEALGAVADGRVEMEGNAAKVYSSTRNKFYTVTYDPETNSIMANDNASYWQGYLGYPAIAYLMKIGVLDFEPRLGELLKGVVWKDINQKFKNDFAKALEHILSPLTPEQKQNLETFAANISAQLAALNLSLLGPKTKPPDGY